MKKRLFSCFLAFAVMLMAPVPSLCAQENETSALSDDGNEKDASAQSDADAAKENASELSDDIYSFQLELNGEIYAFPMSYADFTARGWKYLGDADLSLQPDQYSSSERFQKDGLEVYASVVNLTLNTIPVTDAAVGGISIDEWQFSEAPDTAICLPRNIRYGVSALDDIKAAYGEASSTYEGDLYTKLTYEYDPYREVELYVSKDTGVLSEISLRNFVTDEDANAWAAAQVSSEPTEEVLAYRAPEKLGDDPLSFVVEYAGSLYQMPAPVSAFLENGWELKAEDSDPVVAGTDFGWVCMRKDNQELRTIARNYSENAASIENCFVTSVEGNVNSTNLPITIPSGAAPGMPLEDLLSALDGIEYTADEETSGTFAYYTIESPENSLDEIEILVDQEEKVVTGIRVSYEPDTLPW